MLRLLSDLNQIVRFDVKASEGLLASGVTGTFVAKSEDLIDLPSAEAGGLLQVWTESNRDKTPGFSPDVTATGNLTVLYGKYRALTDQFTGNPTAGDALEVAADGTLTTAGTGAVVAYCTKAAHTIEHLDAEHSVIEIITV